MSRAEKHLRKQKKLNVAGKALPVHCQHCGVEVSSEIYEMAEPWNYVCKMCGKPAFSTLKERIEANRAFDLGEAVEKEKQKEEKTDVCEVQDTKESV